MRRSPLLLALALAACSAPRPITVPVPDEPGDLPVPALADAVRIVDTATLEPRTLDALLDRLARADVVFVGETHLDDVTHRVELAILEGLHARRDGNVVLSMEMFERDEQAALDDYLAGRCDEAAFLERVDVWGNYASDYRPLIEFARTHGVPVVAANTPVGLRRKVASGGRAALEGLAPDERRLMPAEVFPATSSYWERVDRATRGHMNFSSLPDEQRLFSTQNLWDNSMGEACAVALHEHPGATVVHVVGGFHVAYRDGTAAQLLRRAPGADVVVVEVAPTQGGFQARPERDAAEADVLVYADAHARSASNGLFAVSVPTELRFSVDIPQGASAAGPAPLLVWLPDVEERPEDARAFWRTALGDEAAVVVVEPPLAWPAADLAPGGRWSRADNRRSDLSAVQTGLERLVEVVTRRLPVDERRVVIAGRGLGARAALWTATYTAWLPARVVAIDPRGTSALRLESLPDQPPATMDVVVMVEPGALEGSTWLRDDQRQIGTPSELVALAPSAGRIQQVEGTLRAALGLAARPDTPAPPTLVAIERDLPRARQWAEIHARRLEATGEPARVVLAEDLTGDEPRVERLAIGGRWTVEHFADGAGIPLAPGDFGGTTVLVVPASASDEERDAWRALEEQKALRKRSPFAGLRVAVEDGEPSLAQVLDELAQRGARSVLVAPATFCASPEEMRGLQGAIGDSGAGLDLVWVPGLGGELCTQ
jgi:uncharacterized iron-regulated protein